METTEQRIRRRTLGTVIRDRRRELGLSQEELAARASDADDEVRQSDISRIERGKVSLPRRARLERIAGALGLHVGELLALSGWAGADVAFTHGNHSPAPVPPDVAPSVAEVIEFDEAPSPTDGWPERPSALPWVRPVDVRAAIQRAHELEARTATLLADAVTILERAGAPPTRRTAPPREVEGEPASTA